MESNPWMRKQERDRKKERERRDEWINECRDVLVIREGEKEKE